MTRSLHCIGVVIVIALTILICTKQAAAQNKNDEKAIRDVIAKFEETWNKHDPDTFIELFAADADFTSPFGDRRNGRDNIKAYHAGVFAAKVKIQISNVRVKFYAENVATVDCEHLFSHRPAGKDGKPLPDTKNFPLYVMKKKHGRWLIAVLHIVPAQSVK